jgi:hypothetical protein
LVSDVFVLAADHEHARQRADKAFEQLARQLRLLLPTG